MYSEPSYKSDSTLEEGTDSEIEDILYQEYSDEKIPDLFHEDREAVIQALADYLGDVFTDSDKGFMEHIGGQYLIHLSDNDSFEESIITPHNS